MVSEVTTTQGFNGLQASWEKLFSASRRSVLQSYPWSRTWWKYFGEPDRRNVLWILVVERDGRVVGIAPLFQERLSIAGVPVIRRAAFIGRELTDYLDLLALPGEETSVAEEVSAHLAAADPAIDVLHLEDIPASSLTRIPLANALRSRGFAGDPFVNELCPRTLLRSTWEDTLASFAINHRREINRRKRNMSKEYAVTCAFANDPSTISRDMDEFISMHQHRWNVSGHQGVFADPRAVDFHKDIAGQFLSRGWLSLAFLALDGKRVAANYGFRYGDDMAIYLTGVGDAGPAWKLSPGRVLMGYCMEEAIASGATVFDFMRGTEQYKYEFDGKDVPNWTILMYRTPMAQRLFKFFMLTTSAGKRMRAEWFGVRSAARERGLVSMSMMSYVSLRVRTILHDGAIKARAPEKSIARSSE